MRDGGARLADCANMVAVDARLRYISASRVKTPVGLVLDQFEVRDSEDANVGRLEGIVVDPVERQVRYFVLKSDRPYRPRHYLLPLVAATIDAGRNALHVDAHSGDLDELVDGPTQTFPVFSDEDLLTALFAPRPH